MKKEKTFGKNFEKTLRKSPINYFSDLFTFSMVVLWIFAILLMSIFAIYSTIMYADNSIWSDLQYLVSVPVSCGGGLWMLKNTVQHYMKNKNGENVEYDFPPVPDTEIEYETEDVFRNDC